MMMKNVDGFEVERDGSNITIKLYDLFEQGEQYVFPERDAFLLALALLRVLNAPV